MATFKWVSDPAQFPFRATSTPRGLAVERSGLADTAHPIEALAASGCPQVGDKLSDDYPGVVVASVQAECLGGIDRGDGSGGACKVTVAYAFPTGGVQGPALPIGDAYTELAVGRETQTLMFDLDGHRDYRIHNGDGVGVEIGVLDVGVHVFVARNANIDLARLVSLMDDGENASCVNDGPISLPPILGTAVRMQLAERQARYRGFQVLARGDSTEIVHDLAVRRNHLERWRREDVNGADAGLVTSRIYNDASFANLWP